MGLAVSIADMLVSSGRLALLLMVANPADTAPPRLEPPRKLSGGAFKVTGYSAPALADFNGDGLLDLALQGAGQGGIYFNRGSKERPCFDRLDVPFPVSDDGSLVALDFDGDGLTDLVWRGTVVLNSGTRTHPVLGSDWHEGEQILHLRFGPLPEGYTFHRRLGFADLNKDGRRDLILTVFKRKPLYVAHSGRWCVAFDEGGGRKGVFGKPQWLRIVTKKDGKDVEFTTHGPHITFADLDADGDPEAVIGTYTDGVLRLIQTGPLTWRLPERRLFDGARSGSFTTPAPGDLNGDGLCDFVIGSYAGALHFVLNTGTSREPKFGTPEQLPGGEFRVAALAGFDLVDYDGDRALDLLVGERSAKWTQGAVKLFRRMVPREPQFQYVGRVNAERQGLLPNASRGYAAPQLTDIDADGDLDLLVCGSSAGRARARVYVHLSRGGRPPALYHHAPLSAEPYFLKSLAGHPIGTRKGYNARWVDLDLDGLHDLVLGGNPVRFSKNIGRPTRPELTEPQPLLAERGKAIAGCVAVGDLNGDGLPDLVTGSRSSGTPLFHENAGHAGVPIFESAVPTNAGDKEVSFQGGAFPLIVDFDGDGAKDLLLGLFQQAEIHWLRSVR